MEPVLATLALGAAVGLGIAIPLGAIGVLLLQTGMVAGWRVAAAGGLGAATVDLAYAAVAVAAGTTAAGLLSAHTRMVQVVGAGALAAVAGHGVVGLLRGRASALRGGRSTVPVTTTRPVRSFGRFVALTAVNPLTVVYFVAVAAGLADRLATPGSAVAFVVGIAVASAAWQLALAAAGAALGSRVRPVVRTALSVLGYAVVGGFAVVLALP
jgi:threonine/homoserine/homoserine lactone efflux protein